MRLALRPGHGRDHEADLLWEVLGAAWVSRTNDELVAGFAEEVTARAAAAATGGELVEVDEGDLSYLDAWRAWARPTRAGRLVVCPPWVADRAAGVGETDAPPEPDLLHITIDPGHAFGHGGHPSTRLVLAALSERLRPGDSVLDVGCGSGVLSVAAAVLGAGSITAVDIDPVALSVTSSNAAANGVAHRISTTRTPLSGVPGRYDVVLANIGASVLRNLASELARRVAPGGWLTLSGLLEHQWAEVARLVPGEVDEVLREGGWAAVVVKLLDPLDPP